MDTKRNVRRGVASIRFWMVLALLLGLSAAAILCQGRGYKTGLLAKLFPSSEYALKTPQVLAITPADRAGGVALDAVIRIDLLLPNGGNGIDPTTLSVNSVRLVRRGDIEVVPAELAISKGGHIITLRPLARLEPHTPYKFEVLPSLRDMAGKPFARFIANFTTAADVAASPFPAAFEQIDLPETNGLPFTGVAIGPDERLYGCTGDGLIIRYDLADTGRITGKPHVIRNIQWRNDGPRLISGIAFDPSSTAASPVLYVNHAQAVMVGAADWTGKLSRLSGEDLEQYEDVVVNLPRGFRDHLNNQPAFGPDGALYYCQGSSSTMGEADPWWGSRPEHALTAAVIRVDVDAIAAPFDARTCDPFAPGAPVSVYATGIRNGWDLLWHRNGHLYVPINGSAAGGWLPAAPATLDAPRPMDPQLGPYSGSPTAAIVDAHYTAPDLLARIERGGYYGHPNPSRGEYIMNGGNPTAGLDPQEVPLYPAGTNPDRNWRPPAFDFGKAFSPVGMLEYRDAGAFGGAMDGMVLVVRYSGGKDILALRVAEDGAVREAVVGIEGLGGFNDPLDIAQYPHSGHLYVVEYGGRRIKLVRPRVTNPVSAQTYRQETHPAGGRKWTMDDLAPLAEAGAADGDAARGRAIFSSAGCIGCHRAGGESTGGSAGPDLSGIAGRMSPRDVLEAIVDPNKSIVEAYRAVIVQMDDDEVQSGRVIASTDGTVTLATNPLDPAARVVIERSRIVRMKESPLSAMPEGLLDPLTREQIRDLLAFVRAARP